MKFNILLLTLALSACSADSPQTKKEENTQPNILLIVADDLGYAEMGAYGGEVNTPTLDALAVRGTKFTDFNVAPTCSPTRSMLMSGVDNHIAGLGSMGEVMIAGRENINALNHMPATFRELVKKQLNQPGYEGYLNTQVHSLPQELKNAGYNTYMAGKWHLGAAKENRPFMRGFDNTFSMLDGAASHFSDGWMSTSGPNKQARYSQNGELIKELPADFYSSTAFVDKMIDWLEKDLSEKSKKPFFSYLAFTAVHDPIHVPDADIDLYADKYNAGYEEIAKQRLAKMKALGLVAESVQLPAKLPFAKPWNSLSAEEKLRSARTMETYAAMLEVMDRELGRLIKFLENSGELENTVVIFMSDNGASPSNHKTYGFKTSDVDNTFENIGRLGSFESYYVGWAQAATVPFDYFKGTSAEGGVRAPLIVSGPNLERNAVSTAFTHVTDLTATILDIAGVKSLPESDLKSMTGKSFNSILKGEAESIRTEQDAIGTELWGSKGLRAGDWKLRFIAPPYGNAKWQLFNVAKDPAEQNDLSVKQPEKLKEMKVLWEEYVKQNNVVI